MQKQDERPEPSPDVARESTSRSPWRRSRPSPPGAGLGYHGTLACPSPLRVDPPTMTLVHPARGPGSSFRNLHLYFALLVPATMLGFWKTYFGILDSLPETMTTVTHVHGALMFLWLLMLIAQAWFIRTKRLRLHRAVGRSSYVIAPAIVISGLLALHKSFNQSPEGVPADIARLDVLAFAMLMAFAASYTLAIVYRRRTTVHVRFIISTAFAIATAIVFRIFFNWVPGTGTNAAAVVANGCTITLPLLALIALDWRRGMKRSPYWVVTLILVVMHFGYWTFAKTDGWFTFCQWYADLPLGGN